MIRAFKKESVFGFSIRQSAARMMADKSRYTCGITLRENQGEATRKAIKFFAEKKPQPSLIVLPTAWGKSILTAFVAKACTDKLIVLQPSKELLDQNYKKYCTLCGGFGVDAEIYSASFNKKEFGRVTYATIGSIKNIGKTFKQMGYTKLLIDEAHLYPRSMDSMLGKFLKDSEITHVLGITATPLKLQSNFSRDGQPFSKLVMLTQRSKEGKFYKKILHVGQVEEMVRLGFWSPLQYQCGEFDASLLEFNSAGSEYTDESVERAHEANGGSCRIVNVLNQHPERRHILAFAHSVKEAIRLSEVYPNSGVVYGMQDKKVRAETIERFVRGEIRVLFNVRVLSTGFDYTGIDCIVMGTSTASVALYYQILGRGTRIDPNKKDCLIADLGGNVNRFGRIEDITFEQGASGMWRMFGSGGRLMTGIPVCDIGTIYREDVERIEANREEIIAAAREQREKTEMRKRAAAELMPFGKYKGRTLKDVPMRYRLWLLRNFSWDERNARLRDFLKASL